MAWYIFITGGVVSSLGNGLASAALGALLQARGYKVRLRKLDPYLNLDPGTMSPYQHGEVFVTDDGAETDLDLGHYERFTGVDARQSDNITTGRIYSTVIAKERRGEDPGQRAAQDRAVLQRQAGARHRSARRRHDLPGADRLSRSGLRPRGLPLFRPRRGQRAQSRSVARCGAFGARARGQGDDRGGRQVHGAA